MGKKKQARPGLDGIAPGAIEKAPTKKERRIAERATKKSKKRLTPGKSTHKSELEKLRKERQGAVKKREQRRAELEKKGALYTSDKAEKEESTYQQPGYRTNVSVRKNILFYEVNLHKVPQQYISVNTTADRFMVDTLEYSKKWVLNIPHPDGIKVIPNEDSGVAEISPDGVLKVKLRIKHLPEAVKSKELAKQKSIESVRNLRFRRNRAGELVAGKRKVTVVTEETGPSKKKKKSKSFVTDKEAALELIDGIQNEEEPKRQERKTMMDHAQDMKAERKERRMAKRQKKQSMEDQAIRSISKTKKAKQKREVEKAVSEVVPLKKPTGRKVRFSAQSK